MLISWVFINSLFCVDLFLSNKRYSHFFCKDFNVYLYIIHQNWLISKGRFFWASLFTKENSHHHYHISVVAEYFWSVVTWRLMIAWIDARIFNHFSTCRPDLKEISDLNSHAQKVQKISLRIFPREHRRFCNRHNVAWIQGPGATRLAGLKKS